MTLHGQMAALPDLAHLFMTCVASFYGFTCLPQALFVFFFNIIVLHRFIFLQYMFASKKHKNGVFAEATSARPCSLSWLPVVVVFFVYRGLVHHFSRFASGSLPCFLFAQVGNSMAAMLLQLGCAMVSKLVGVKTNGTILG